MKSESKNLIYVGGINRSGSTWTGNVIGKSKKVRYLHEPFHPRRNHNGNPFRDFFQYLNPNEKGEIERKLKKYLNKICTFRIPKLYDVKDTRNSKKVSFFYHPYSFMVSKLRKEIPLIKDPPSILLTEWLDKNYKAKILITIRHPAAFVYSSKKQNWHYGMNTFLNQTNLMKDYLSGFREELEKEVRYKQVEFSVRNSVLFWRVIHHILLEWQRKHSNWFFCRHEDLLENPMAKFEEIFQYLEIPMDQNVVAYIESSTNVKGEDKELRLKRDRKKLRKEWKTKLSEEEIEYIKIKSVKEWKGFYGEADW